MSLRQYRYCTCDVFTQQRFGGNPLAVVLDAQGLADAEMHSIAREFNYSETTFVLPPKDARHTAQVRIFTPGGELPFAGHPTVGTAFVLATLGIVPRTHAGIVFEEGVGPVPVHIERQGNEVQRCTLTAAQLPVSEGGVPTRSDLAQVLTLTEADIGDGAAVWSCGVPFLVVPLASVDALARCRPSVPAWSRLQAAGSQKPYVVARIDDHTWRVRMFAPTLGVLEDPATGSAAASFAGWLAARTPGGDGETRVALLQGSEMGRPSELALTFDRRDGIVTAVRVGGAAVMLMQGTLLI